MSGRSRRHHVSEAIPGDERGPYPRDRLLKMDEKFCARLERAIRRDKQHAPVHFTDQQLGLLRELAAPLSPKQRPRFLDLVMKYLAGCEIGDATVHVAGLRAQQELRREAPWLE